MVTFAPNSEKLRRQDHSSGEQKMKKTASTSHPTSGYAADKPSGYAANLPDRKVIHVPVISTFSASLQTAAVTVPRAPWEVQA
jgi:hypothetical protein